ncbi:MAG: hypothetical protein QGI53_10370, partial [SAR324 cluster bacterium]|nr:hypothetical protein [SAR324 cluster bacterium]
LLVRAGNFAELDTERYDYLSILEIRNIFDNLRIDVFDQSFERRGNKQQIKLTNCEGKSEPVSLGEISRNLRYPDEFLTKIASTARMLDLRDFIGLGEVEFQNRMFAEIKRVIDSGTPHTSSRMAMATQERAEEIPTGMLKINLEKAQTWKNEGMTAFRLRKESSPWKTYHSDQDNRIVMHLPAGAYYLKVGGILRKTFFLIAGTQLDLAVE